MRILIFGVTALLLSGCAGSGMRNSMGAGTPQPVQVPPYQQPAHLRPTLTQRMPQEDVCNSRLYLGLIGQHEGGIAFESLQGRVRVVKPAQTGMDRDEFLQDMQPEAPYLEVREYLAGQVLYAPSIRAVRIGDGLGPIEQERITVELDREGFVTQLNCR